MQGEVQELSLQPAHRKGGGGPRPPRYSHGLGPGLASSNSPSEYLLGTEPGQQWRGQGLTSQGMPGLPHLPSGEKLTRWEGQEQVGKPPDLGGLEREGLAL